jgi:hypothetical protein
MRKYKLLFTLTENFGKDLVLIANNRKDLEEHLKENYNWFAFVVEEMKVYIKKREGFEVETATLEWVEHI